MDYLGPIACDSLAIQLFTASTGAWDVLQQSKLTKSYRTPLAAHFGLTTQNYSNLQLAHPLSRTMSEREARVKIDKSFIQG